MEGQHRSSAGVPSAWSTDECPGIGSGGVHTKASFLAKLEWCRAKLCAGASDWGVTGGKQRTYPFRDASSMRVSIAKPSEWFHQQLPIQRVTPEMPDSDWREYDRLPSGARCCC